MKRILFLRDKGLCYDSLNGFRQLLGEALTEAGCSVSYASPDELENYIGLCDMVIGFNIQTNIKDSHGVYLYDSFGVPVVDFIVDHPYMHHQALSAKLRQLYVLCLDDNHVSYIKRCYPHIAGVYRTFLTGQRAEHVPAYEKRRYEVLFSGSYADEQKILEGISQLGDVVAGVCYDVIQYLLDNPNQTEEFAFDKVLAKSGVEMNREEYAAFLHFAMPSVDYFFRNYYRHVLITDLVEAGLPVTVCGNGWSELSCAANPNLTILPPVSFEQTFSMIADSKILLNIMPWFKAGLHDRIFTAMLNETVCVTDTSDVIERLFTNHRELVSFSLTEKDVLPQLVGELLENPRRAEEIARQGFAKAKEQFGAREIANTVLQVFAAREKGECDGIS